MAETIPVPETITPPAEPRWDEFEELVLQAEAEGAPAPQLLLPTLADAARAARRLAEIRRDEAIMASLYDEEIERLQREIEAVRERKQQALRPFERCAGWYEFALEQWHRAELERNPRAKTIKLPAGDLRLRAQQPEWIYGDDLLERLKAIRATAYIRVKEEPDRMALKKAAQIIHGRAALVDSETGEVYELPIEVVERSPKFEFVPVEVTT